MKKMSNFFTGHRRWLSILMIFALVMGMMPGMAFATEDGAETVNLNPSFTVEYFATLDLLAESEPAGKLTSLEVIDTSGANLPTNSTTPATKNIYIASDNTVAVEADQLKPLYAAETYSYYDAPSLAYFDKVSQATDHYVLQKILVQKGENSWDEYDPATVTFTNTGESNSNTICITEGMVLRLVYDQAAPEAVSNGAVVLFDYDITDGKVYADSAGTTVIEDLASHTGNKYLKTEYQGINSHYDRASDKKFYAFGNANVYPDKINIPYVWNTWEGENEYFNQANHTNYKYCTFGLVERSLGGDAPVFATSESESIYGPDIFGSSEETGKTVLSDYSMTFNRVGDTYTLTDVKNGDTGVSNLHKIVKVQEGTWSNNFWPFDNAVGAGLDYKFGAKGDPVYPCGTKSTHESYRMPLGDDGLAHNSYFGMKYKVKFDLSEDYMGPLEYLFYGDDDMWVFLDGQLICDIGGVHSSVGEYVNLWDYLKTTDKDGNETIKTGEHTMDVFYTERGASGSSCYMQFTLPSVTFDRPPAATYGSLKVTKTVDTVEAEAGKDLKFNFNAVLTDSADVPLKDDCVYTVYDSNGTPTGKTGLVRKGEVSFTLQHGQYAEIPYLPLGTKYTVNETPVDKYIPSVDKASGTIEKAQQYCVNYTNTYDYEKLLCDLTINKVVDGCYDNESYFNKNLPKFEFEIKDASDAVVKTAEIQPSRTQKVDEATGEPMVDEEGQPVYEYNWSTKVEDLPYGTYTVVEKEQQLERGYSVKVSGTGKVTLEEGDKNASVTVTNTYSYTENAAYVYGYKVWDDNNNQDGIRPDAVVFGLYIKDKLVEKKAASKVVEAEENKFYAEFMYDSHQYPTDASVEVKEIGYTVGETEYLFDGTLTNVPGYTASKEVVLETEEDGTKNFTFTNSHEPETITIPVQKVWGTEGKQNSYITVILKADGKEINRAIVFRDNNPPEPEEELVPSEPVPAEAISGDTPLEPVPEESETTRLPDWRYVFEAKADGTPLYKCKDGKEIEYTIEEKPLGIHWYKHIEKNTEGIWVITNTYKEPYIPDPPVVPEEPPQEPPVTPPEEPVITPEDPDVPAGGKEVDDPLYDLNDGDIPMEGMEIEDPAVPKTADGSHVNIWMLIALLSGMALAVSAIAERRQGKHNA